MSYAKERRPTWSPGSAEDVQVLTLSGASGVSGTEIEPTGVTTILSTGTGAGWSVAIAARPAVEVGTLKRILVRSASTAPVTVVLPSTATTIFGSTTNAVAFSTGAGVRSVSLVKVSATQWGVAGISTGASLAASTVE